MHYLQDDYSHESPDLFYSPRSIPGPGARELNISFAFKYAYLVIVS